LLSAAADEHRRGCLLRMLSGLLLVRACERERERERERHVHHLMMLSGWLECGVWIVYLL